MPQLRSIELFLAVAAERSYTRAAMTTGVSETVLSRTVRALEAEVGGALVRRAGQRGLELTRLGEYVASLATSVTTSAAELTDFAGRLALGEVGAVTIGWPAHGLGRLGELLLRQLRVRRPGISVTTVHPDLDAGLRPLQEGRCDVLLVHGEVPAGHMVTPPFAREPRLVAVARSSPLAGAEEVPECALARLAVVPCGPSWCDGPGDTWGPLPAADLREPAGGVEEVFERVRRGEGVAVVPDGLARHYRPRGIRFVPSYDLAAAQARFAWPEDAANPSVAAAVGTMLLVSPHHPDLGGLLPV